jgi:hypothetical protein
VFAATADRVSEMTVFNSARNVGRFLEVFEKLGTT